MYIIELPTSCRDCSVIATPFVLGKRWYLSSGSPLDLANSTLYSCLAFVKRVPSAYMAS